MAITIENSKWTTFELKKKPLRESTFLSRTIDDDDIRIFCRRINATSCGAAEFGLNSGNLKRVNLIKQKKSKTNRVRSFQVHIVKNLRLGERYPSMDSARKEGHKWDG